MLMLAKDQMKVALVTYAVEQSLLEKGGSETLQSVISILEKKYNAKIEDCYEHPDYLHDVIEELYSDSAKEIAKSIKSKLEEFEYQDPIAHFMKEICV